MAVQWKWHRRCTRESSRSALEALFTGGVAHGDPFFLVPGTQLFFCSYVGKDARHVRSELQMWPNLLQACVALIV